MRSITAPRNTHEPRAARHLLLAALAILPQVCTPAAQVEQQTIAFDPMRGSLTRDEPQPIYSVDPRDPWNQVFYLLFTRTVPARVLADGALPFAGRDRDILQDTDRAITRIESGDRAIDPLYPSWHWMNSQAVDFDAVTHWRILQEPRYTRLLTSLTQVRRTATSRASLARALMQADLWSAYDLLHFGAQPRRGRPRPGAAADGERRATLLAALAATMHALALSREEIGALPDNYAAGVAAGHLPDLLGEGSEWMEIRWLPDRMHDRAAGLRRATRVFVKPASRPTDEAAFLDQFRAQEEGHLDALDSVGLLIQLLLVSKRGEVVPSSITYEAQFRGTVTERTGSAPVVQHELSRRLLLRSPSGGGFEPRDTTEPAYVPVAGNDLSFAAPPRLGAPSIVAPLATRCQACHGPAPAIGTVMTFSFHAPPGRPVERLSPTQNVHGRDVARRKMEQENFKALRTMWLQ